MANFLNTPELQFSQLSIRELAALHDLSVEVQKIVSTLSCQPRTSTKVQQFMGRGFGAAAEQLEKKCVAALREIHPRDKSDIEEIAEIVYPYTLRMEGFARAGSVLLGLVRDLTLRLSPLQLESKQ